MALYYFLCKQCDKSFSKLLSTEEDEWPCPVCKAQAIRAPRAPSSQVLEVVDNGLMARRIERVADADRVFRERAINHQNRLQEQERVLNVSPEDAETIAEEKDEIFIRGK